MTLDFVDGRYVIVDDAARLRRETPSFDGVVSIVRDCGKPMSVTQIQEASQGSLDLSLPATRRWVRKAVAQQALVSSGGSGTRGSSRLYGLPEWTAVTASLGEEK